MQWPRNIGNNFGLEEMSFEPSPDEETIINYSGVLLWKWTGSCCMLARDGTQHDPTNHFPNKRNGLSWLEDEPVKVGGSDKPSRTRWPEPRAKREKTLSKTHTQMKRKRERKLTSCQPNGNGQRRGQWSMTKLAETSRLILGERRWYSSMMWHLILRSPI